MTLVTPMEALSVHLDLHVGFVKRFQLALIGRLLTFVHSHAFLDGGLIRIIFMTWQFHRETARSDKSSMLLILISCRLKNESESTL